MCCQLSTLVCVLFIIVGTTCQLRMDYRIPSVIADIGSRGNPGISAKITSIGLAYLREIGMRLINKQLRKLKFKETITAQSPVGKGTIKLHDIKIIDYWRPETYDLELVPNREFTWIMRGLGVRASGRFGTDIQLSKDETSDPIRATGTWDALIDYMDFDMTIKMGMTNEGIPTVEATDCHTNIRGLDIEIENAGILTTVISFIRGTISQQVKPLLAKEICRKTVGMINNEANDLMSTLPLKIPLDGSKPPKLGAKKTTTPTTPSSRSSLNQGGRPIARPFPGRSGSRLPNRGRSGTFGRTERLSQLRERRAEATKRLRQRNVGVAL